MCVGDNDAEQSVKQLSCMLESYLKYNVVGSVFFNSATPPCFTCGFGTTCRYGGPARWMTPEEFENFNEITPEMFQNFEDHPDVVAACENLSRQLKQAIAGLAAASLMLRHVYHLEKSDFTDARFSCTMVLSAAYCKPVKLVSP